MRERNKQKPEHSRVVSSVGGVHQRPTHFPAIMYNRELVDALVRPIVRSFVRYLVGYGCVARVPQIDDNEIKLSENKLLKPRVDAVLGMFCFDFASSIFYL